MTQDEVEKFKEDVWNKFDFALIDLRYNNLPDEDIVDLMEDAILRIRQLASEVGVDIAEFI